MLAFFETQSPPPGPGRGDQAAWFAGTWMTSMPFSNLTPAMTFGN